MLRVTPHIAIPEEELSFRFVRASGPGGQHVNKTSTACQLRFDTASSPSLPDDVRRRLLRLAGSRADQDGTITIDARGYRSQKRNRDDARHRLAELIRLASHRPRPRRRTRPTAASRRRRLDTKRRRGLLKRYRKPPPTE